MNRFDIQRLRDLPIEGVAQSLGMNVQRHKTLCPYHDDKHPSLSFHVRSNTFKCFVCDAHGGTIDLAMHVLGKDFKEACQWLANGEFRPSISPLKGDYQSSPLKGDTRGASFNAQRYERYFQRPFLNAAARHFLFQERKLHPAVIRWCRLNSYTDRHGTPWLQIPYYDVAGNLIGVQSRRLGSSKSPLKGDLPESGCGRSNHPPLRGTGEGLPRFIFPSGSKISIYNLPILKMLQPGEDLWITEGCSDCWAMLSSGRKAIAIPSATLLKASDLDILSPHFQGGAGDGSLHMYPDNDEPGERLYLQLKEHFPQLERHPLPHGCKDFGQYWAMSCEQ